MNTTSDSVHIGIFPHSHAQLRKRFLHISYGINMNRYQRNCSQ
jgi:hypothetical protein